MPKSIIPPGLAHGLCAAAAVSILAGCAGRMPPATEAAIIRAEDTRSPEGLGALAREGDAGTRERALLALGRIGRPADAPILLDAAREEEHPRVQAAALFALGEMQDTDTLQSFGASLDEKTVPALIRQVGSPEPIVSGRAAEALGKVRDGRATPSLVKSLEGLAGELSPEGRTQARLVLTALIRLKAKEAGAAVALMTKSPHAELRAVAAIALRRLALKEQRKWCVDLLADPDAEVRADAARAVASLGGPEDEGALLRLLQDEDYNVRVETLAALAKLNTGSGLIEMRRLLRVLSEGLGAKVEKRAAPAEDGDDALDLLGDAVAGSDDLDPALYGSDRGRADNMLVVIIDALAENEQDAGVLDILDRLRRRDDVIGYRSQIAFAKIAGRTHNESRLLPATGGAGQGLRHLAMALAFYKRPAAEFPLAGFLQPGESTEKEQGALPEILSALHQVDPAGSMPYLLGALRHPDPYVRARAAGLLAPEDETAEPPAEALAPLLLALRADKSPAGDVRLSFLDTLSRYRKSPEARHAIEAALADNDRNVRMFAMKLLSRGSDRDVETILGPRPSSATDVSSLPPEAADLFYERLAARPDRVVVRLHMMHHGPITLELYPHEAPVTVENFVSLAKRGYFDGLSFHRVVQHFVLQGGDPRQDMEGGPGYTIPCEINTLPFERGSVGMALSGKDTGGSQFFICLGPQPHLDGGYTVFGRVIEGDGVLDKVTQFDGVARVEVAD